MTINGTRRTVHIPLAGTRRALWGHVVTAQTGFRTLDRRKLNQLQKPAVIRMMTVLLIIHSVTTDVVISAVNAITATMELTEPVVRAVMDIPLERAVIVRVLMNQLQVLDHRKLQGLSRSVS